MSDRNRIRRITAVSWFAVPVALMFAWPGGTAQLVQARAAQDGIASNVVFEVAAIRRAVDPSIGSGIRPVTPGGVFTAVLTVEALIRVAYGYPLALLDSQLVAGPDWIRRDRFEIIAKPEGPLTEAAGGPPVRLFAMMRNLLADRFTLQLRTDIRQLPIYDLVVDRTDRRLGARLRTASGQCISIAERPGPVPDPSRVCGFTRLTPGSISAQGMTMDVLAAGLSQRADVQRRVRDRTGLTGTFDFDVEYTPALAAPVDPLGATPVPNAGGPTLFTALREQLGLRLEPTTGPVDVFIIERVEVPTLD